VRFDFNSRVMKVLK